MEIKIYQINRNRDKNFVKFLHYKHLDNFQETKDINASIYDEVFRGDADCEDLEDVYRMFNTEGHPLHRGHSLSVSDIVVTKDGAYYCDSVGFLKVDFDEAKTQKPDNLMTVVYVEPNKAPYVTEIAHTLEAEQKAVGGLIEPIYNDDETCLVGNEEAKLIGMEGNRYLDDGHSIIAGPFFVCGLTEDDFRGLTEEEVQKYMNKYAEPENISQEEVETDTGFMLYPMVLSAFPISAFAAPASDIPDKMLDNPIVRALAYTGYNVQKQKDNGTIYQTGHYGGALKRNAPSILSDIHYSTSLTGKETVSDSSTVTGKAPNIARFEQYGLCCASFVTYYICNYLPNIEGVDTQFITDAINATGTNSQAVVTWQNALNKLASQGKIEKVGTSPSNVDYSKLTPGDIIIFGNSSSSHVHAAIFAGVYDGKHFIIHVC